MSGQTHATLRSAAFTPSAAFRLRRLGMQPYEQTWRAMQAFSADRNAASPDELWQVEHPPVYTLGLAGKTEHLLRETDIPVVKTDRGGQITYHGPGQAVVYVLLDMNRRSLKVRELVRRIEQAAIDMLADYGVKAERLSGAPGVYVAGAKIAALGLRVKGGCCYHGIALNVAMDLAPYANINPCGYAGMRVTQLRDLGVDIDTQTAGEALLAHLARELND